MNVVRLDNVAGVRQPAYLRSVVLAADANNGTFVTLGTLADGEREIFNATVTKEGDKNVALLASPEVIVNNATKNDVTDFTNVAGVPARAYLLQVGDQFSVTGGTYVVGTAVTVGNLTIMPIAKETVGDLAFDVLEVRA